MLPKVLAGEMLGDLLNTAIVTLVAAAVYFAIYFIFVAKDSPEKTKKRFRVRLFYIVAVIYLIFIAKIWVAGFIHIFYGLSLVSAGLVVTNKESIMNVVGSLIITWRGLFAEGDYIQIDKYSGFVHELGIIYFKLFQASETSINRSSGKMIKLPNGLVINNPVINFSPQNNVIEYHQMWIITPDSNLTRAKELVMQQTQQVIAEFYADNEGYSSKYVKRNCRLLSRLIDFEVHIKSHMRFDKPGGVELQASYYCYPCDRDELDEAICQAVLKVLREAPEVQLSFAT